MMCVEAVVDLLHDGVALGQVHLRLLGFDQAVHRPCPPRRPCCWRRAGRRCGECHMLSGSAQADRAPAGPAHVELVVVHALGQVDQDICSTLALMPTAFRSSM